MDKRKKEAVVLTLFAVFIGILVAVQTTMPHGEKLYVSAKTLEEMKIQVESETENIQKTALLIEDSKKKLADYEALISLDETDKLLETARAELNHYKLISGQTPVQGPGVSVIIRDSERELMEGENVNSALVHDIDVLMVLNDLLTAGAEAISVNGHRVIDMSAVTCAGYTIRINGMREAVPFRIEAIGDQGRLYAALMAPGSYGKEYLEPQVDFRVKTADDIVIRAYPGIPSKYYSTVNKEGESN